MGFLIKGKQFCIYSEGKPVRFRVGAAHCSNNNDHREMSGHEVIPGVPKCWQTTACLCCCSQESNAVTAEQKRTKTAGM